MERLSRIVKATGAEIVLSSTWRFDWEGPNKPELGTSLYALRATFRKYGMEIVDKTPLIINENHWKDTLRGSREKEIFYWLSKHPEVEKFIIIDDMEDLFSSNKAFQHLVLTDEYDGGLTEELAQQAITMLM